MGGFEGGDEGGFWDEDALHVLIEKQNSKKNLKKEKIYKKSDDAIYTIEGNSTISFVPCECESFTIECSLDNPQIYQTIENAYKTLLDVTSDDDIAAFFLEYKVVIGKGENSKKTLYKDTEAFLLLCKEVCNLLISSEELGSIATSSQKIYLDS